MLYKDERWRGRGSWVAAASEGGGISDKQTKAVKRKIGYKYKKNCDI